jgi:NAD(P)-dependent dehydrogenase (short-subunit alcohol dehydrogenase family)
MDFESIRRLYDFTGQTVVLSGGTGVLGSEILCALAGLGANVAALSRKPALPEHLTRQLKGAPGQVAVFQADVLDRDALSAAERAIRARFGPPHLLVNGAGGNQPAATTNPSQSFFDLPEDALRAVFDLNLLGAVLPSQVFGRAMAEQQRGVILNVSSMSAYRPLTRVVAYSAAKAGLGNFTQWLATHMALEYSPNIRVNAIAPGFFLTDQNRFLMLDRDTEKLTPRGQAIFNHIPMARFGSPADLIGTVLWLLSPASAYVTGIVVPVDGGFSAYNGI